MAERNKGGDNNWYLVDVPNPKRLTPYTMEVDDIIEACDMTFAEGVVLKSLIRRCNARKHGITKLNYDGPAYDGEKIEYYGNRIVAQDRAAMGTAEAPELGVEFFTGAIESSRPGESLIVRLESDGAAPVGTATIEQGVQLAERVESLRNASAIAMVGAEARGDYAVGYANGLLLALGIMDNEEPEFLSAAVTQPAAAELLAQEDTITRTMGWFAAAGQMTAGEVNARQAAFYIGMQLEELGEKLELVFGHENTQFTNLADSFKRGSFNREVETALLVNPGDFLDSDLDQIWVSIGAAMAQGANVQAAYDEVARANWDKFPGGVCTRDTNGKVVKPQGWKAPDLTPHLHAALLVPAST